MATEPARYRWSSYACRGEGKKDLLVDFDSAYLAHKNNAIERIVAYAGYVLDTVPEYEIKLNKYEKDFNGWVKNLV